jgi:hypothetical protein
LPIIGATIFQMAHSGLMTEIFAFSSATSKSQCPMGRRSDFSARIVNGSTAFHPSLTLIVRRSHKTQNPSRDEEVMAMTRPASKIDPQKRDEMMARYLAGETSKSLGAEYGVSASYARSFASASGKTRNGKWRGETQRREIAAALHSLAGRLGVSPNYLFLCANEFPPG